jgi:hypothetical protein
VRRQDGNKKRNERGPHHVHPRLSLSQMKPIAPAPAAFNRRARSRTADDDAGRTFAAAATSLYYKKLDAVLQ